MKRLALIALLALGCATKDTTRKLVRDSETNESYHIVDGELRGAYDYIRPDKDGIVRYSNLPGWMRTTLSEDKIIVEFFDGEFGKYKRVEEAIDSKKGKMYKRRFEKDRELLEKAGLVE
jgi:hypothetical protein